MQSFYGGKPGKSFLIVQRFKSQTEMNEAFSQGANYKLVHYGEYVIIDTDDKNDPSNGKVYKRGTNGAEYFAQIVGPAGQAPSVNFTTYQDITNIQNEQEGKIVIKDQGEYTSSSLLPGKQQMPYYQGGNIQYRDEIKWKSCRIRDVNNRTEDFYIGFQIPYLVVDFTATSISPYSSLNIAKTNAGDGHPFYDEWNINIPAPKKGNEIKNIRIFDWFEHRNDINDVEDYSGRYDDWNEGRTPGDRCIWVGDYYDYSETANPTPKTIYLGDYNVISNFYINNDGTITTKKTHSGQSTTQNSVVKWPTNIEMDQHCNIITTWNDETTSTITEEPINYITDMTVVNNQILVKYSDENKQGNIFYGTAGWKSIGNITVNYEQLKLSPSSDNQFVFSNIALKGFIKKYTSNNEVNFSLTVTMPTTYPLNIPTIKQLTTTGASCLLKYDSNKYEGYIPYGTSFTQDSQGLTFTISIPNDLRTLLSSSMTTNTIDSCDVIIENLILLLISR